MKTFQTQLEKADAKYNRVCKFSLLNGGYVIIEFNSEKNYSLMINLICNSILSRIHPVSLLGMLDLSHNEGYVNLTELDLNSGPIDLNSLHLISGQ